MIRLLSISQLFALFGPNAAVSGVTQSLTFKAFLCQVILLVILSSFYFWYI